MTEPVTGAVPNPAAEARRAPFSRSELIGLLASFAGRDVPATGDQIDSLELAWLVHQIEQRYGHPLDLSDDHLAQMSTVDGVLAVLDRLTGAVR
jgi:hypothetical protein